MQRDEAGLEVLQDGQKMDVRPLRLRHETASSGEDGETFWLVFSDAFGSQSKYLQRPQRRFMSA